VRARNGWIIGGAAATAAAGTAVAAARRVRRARQEADAVVRAVTVDRPEAAVRDLAADPARLALTLDRPVTPAGTTGYEVDGVTVTRTADAPDGLRWRVAGGPAAHEGRLTLRPAPGGRGTELRVTITGARRPRRADRAVRTLLRRAKSVLETGEVVTTMYDPSARGPVAEAVTKRVREALATGARP